MTRDELSAGWARLKNIYERMPELGPAIAREWLRVLEPFSGADLDEAISLWIASQKYRPIPVDMAAYCRKAQKKRKEAEIEAEIASYGECPWCGGLGYIGQFLEPEEPDRYYYCICPSSPDREKGAKILAQARADEAWVFDKERHGFTRRRVWIGDEQADDTPLPAEVQLDFWREAFRVGRDL